MLNCISKENLLYVKASNIFVGFEFRGNSSAAAYATVSYDGKYSLQGTTQSRYLTGGVPPVRFSM